MSISLTLDFLPIRHSSRRGPCAILDSESARLHSTTPLGAPRGLCFVEALGTCEPRLPACYVVLFGTLDVHIRRSHLYFLSIYYISLSGDDVGRIHLEWMHT